MDGKAEMFPFFVVGFDTLLQMSPHPEEPLGVETKSPVAMRNDPTPPRYVNTSAGNIIRARTALASSTVYGSLDLAKVDKYQEGACLAIRLRKKAQDGCHGCPKVTVVAVRDPALSAVRASRGETESLPVIATRGKSARA